MAQQLHIIEGISDDISIAQGLLGKPNIPLRRRTSFTSTTRSDHVVEATNEGYISEGIREEGRRRRMVQSSNTWTMSSGEALSELDDVEDRTFFVREYNRLALKHGVRTLHPEVSDSSNAELGNALNKSGSWFSRKILRRTSSTQSVKAKSLTKHRRSISDLSLRLKLKNDSLKDKDLQELVRLCGLSLLYLPTEYAASSLAVPTCFRATAQYLVQHASTARGIFRIPGSHNIVASLYNHYCTMNGHGEVVAGTVRCPTLPEHIKCDVHDVASAFKKFISGLPGGILGSLPLFDAFISIQSQLNGTPELTRTKQSKVRARLIALAIATLRSQYRRELICAVFGLLSMIGRAAEIAPRENERGRPLPTSDLMGYGPLGIVFGPLLVGGLLETYTMRLANPRGGLVLLPISPPKSRKEKTRKAKTSEDSSAFNSHIDKIKIANSITEMLITHWRDVVRHMRNLKALKVMRSCKSQSLEATAPKQPFLRPSASESFALRKPPDWDNDNSPHRQVERCESPTPASRGGGLIEGRFNSRSSPMSNDTLTVRKQRSRLRPVSSQMLSGARSMSILSPTKEENPAEGFDGPPGQELTPVTPPRHKCTPPQTSTPIPIRSSVNQITKTSAARSIRHSITQSSEASAIAPSLPSAVPPAYPSVTQSARDSVPQPARTSVPQATQSTQNFYPFLDNPWATNNKSLDGPESTPSKTGAGDGSQPLQEHGLKDCHPTTGEELAAVKPKLSLTQIRLMGPRQPEPLAQQRFPAITVSRVPSSGLAIPESLRRISASEPGLCPENPIQRPLRSSKSTYGDSAQGIAVRDWAAPSKDPLTRVSVADDLASLAALAHVLEEEPAETESHPNHLENTVGPNRDQATKPHGMCDVEKPSTKVVEGEPREKPSKKFDAFRRRTIEGRLEAFEARYDTTTTSNGLSIIESVGKPKAIEGPKYSYLAGRTPSPVKKPSQQANPKTRSPINIKHGSPVVALHTSATDVHVEKTEGSVNNSPRPSVRDLAAKFNTGDSRSLSSPSPLKFPSKVPSIDVRAVSDYSPKDKIIAPYTTNPPSPAKSQKSDASVRSVQIPPPLDGKFSKPSPPRKLLRSDVNGSKPLRSVRKGEVTISAKGATILDISKLSACCSPLGSPQRMSLYDGPSSNQISESDSSDPIQCPVSPHVHFEPRKTATTSEQHATIAYLNEPSSIPVAINPLASPPPTRSNSLLHAQIRTLQQQLNNKTEEIRHLKQQLGTRGTLDIGALSEELRDAKKELQIWKSRAEVAEKQLEIMATLSSRSTRQNTENSPSTAVGHSSPTLSRAKYVENGTLMRERIRGTFHGMDGASSRPGGSESSTETVIHGIRGEAIIGSEYSMWVEQKMNTIEFMAAQGAE